MRGRRLFGAVLAFLLLAGTLSFAQEYRGNLFVTVTTDEGQVAVGAIVKLVGTDYTRTATTNDRGEARFIKLQPGSYTLVVEFQGYNRVVEEGVTIDPAANTQMGVKVSRAEIVQEYDVVAVTPLLDQRKVGQSTVLSPEELSKIPQARDPWALLATIPGLQSDRINVGGNQSGQQSQWVGRGDDGDNATWVMDGVDFTDNAAAGSSSTYFDFNSFDSIVVTSTAADFEQTSPGQRLSFITKQGANTHTGSMRLLWADQDYQSNNTPDLPAQPDFQGNVINETFEKNFEIGGPIVADKAWYWFGFNKNDINLGVPKAGGGLQPDRTELQNISLKVHGYFNEGKTNYKLYYTEGDKVKTGRNASISRPPETTWDQEGPTPIYTGDISHFFTQDLEVSLQVSKVGGGFQLVPQGGLSPQVSLGPDFIWGGSFINYVTDRPTNQYAIRGNYFRSTGSVEHEFKFGYKYKDAEITSLSNWTDQGLISASFFGDFGLGDYREVWLIRERNSGEKMKFTTLWFGDTMLWGNWSVTAGVTYLKQTGRQLASKVREVPIAPTILPGISFNGFDPGFAWEDFLPRVGFTYTFDSDRRFLVRGGWARYVDNLSSGVVSANNPVNQSEIDYEWCWADDNSGMPGFSSCLGDDGLPNTADDLFGNGDNWVDANELGAPTGFFDNVDPNDPGSLIFVNDIDRGLEAPQVEEFTLGAEYELAPDFTLAANLTFRTRDRTLWSPLYRDRDAGTFLTAADWSMCTAGDPICDDSYAATGTFPDSGAAYSEPVYYLATDISATNPLRSTRLTNRPGYQQDYKALDLIATKRLSNKWMLRGWFTYSKWTQKVPRNSLQDPTNFQGGTAEDGGDVAVSAGSVSGAFGDVWMGTARWQANVNGLYQLPRDMYISANVQARQGYGIPFYHRVTNVPDADGFTSTKLVQIGKVTDRRYKDLVTVDLKFGKLIKVGGTTVELSVEAFNLFNEDTVLQNDRRVNTSTYSTYGPRVDEILSPRIFRFGALITF